MIVAAHAENIGQAAELLRAGEVIAFDRVRVRACGDALNPMSGARIFAEKNRPHLTR